jgi:hypothetical protein
VKEIPGVDSVSVKPVIGKRRTSKVGGSKLTKGHHPSAQSRRDFSRKTNPFENALEFNEQFADRGELLGAQANVGGEIFMGLPYPGQSRYLLAALGLRESLLEPVRDLREGRSHQPDAVRRQ